MGPTKIKVEPFGEELGYATLTNEQMAEVISYLTDKYGIEATLVIEPWTNMKSEIEQLEEFVSFLKKDDTSPT